MGSLKIGRGTEEGVQVGPLVDGEQRNKVAGLAEDALGKGAKALVEAGEADGRGYFYEPTVVSDVPEDAELRRRSSVPWPRCSPWAPRRRP